MQKIMLTLVATAVLSGCSLMGVYKIDIPQGSPLTQNQVSQVQVGMTQQQVRYFLGSPSLTDTLNPNQWDYIYHYTPGTYARKEKIPAAQGQRLRLVFNAQGILEQIEGQPSIPASQQGLPASKDPLLNAPRL
ncbi:MAG: outer membrane protein assembly factor BamE [Pseudomonadota bacterium]|nr:outer membrane protein assembly factor BamE [Pseudomonadota bacterium]